MSGDNIQEVLHAPFDINTHKATFIHYFEVILDEAGRVHYAVPSHMEWLIAYTCKKLNINRDELARRCLADPTADVMLALTKLSGCIAVWENHIEGKPNYLQHTQLYTLKQHGLYLGPLGGDFVAV